MHDEGYKSGSAHSAQGNRETLPRQRRYLACALTEPRKGIIAQRGFKLQLEIALELQLVSLKLAAAGNNGSHDDV